MSLAHAPAPLVTDDGLAVRPLRRVEFEALVEAGHLVDERVELLDGHIVVKMTESPRHYWLVTALADFLIRRLPEDIMVHVGHPWAAGEMSQPEPDLAIISRALSGSVTERPSSASALVEVSNTSLRQDLGRKAGIYARAGAPEYWVVDVTDEIVHVHLDPGPNGYRTIEPHAFTDTRTLAGVPVRIADLLDD